MATSWTTLLAAALFAVVAYRALGDALHRWAVANLTALNELEELGRDRRDGEKIKGTVVICGGSIAGLLAARICSGHFEDVLILDPDNELLTDRAQKSLPDTPLGGPADKNVSQLPRARVMQTKIIHASQVLNFLALERLWTDVRMWLTTAGAVIGRPVGSSYMDGTHIPAATEFYQGGLMPEVFSMTRSAYETLLRFLVTRIPNVRFAKGTVTGIHVDKLDSKRIESVSYRGGADGTTTNTQTAKLIIDCTGVSHAGYTWLKRAGFTLPQKEVYDPHMRYYTTEFTVDPEIMEKIVPSGFKGRPFVGQFGAPIYKEQNVVGITQVEHNRSKCLHFMTGGWAFKGEINNVAEIRDYIKTMRQTNPQPKWVWELLDYLEGGPEKTAVTAVASAGPLYYIKYHEDQGLPSNFLAIGDSVMKVNPVFGQGLTKAMICNIVLNHWLLRQGSDLSPSFSSDVFGMLHNKLMTTWDGTKYVDYMLDTTDPSAGETLKSGAALRWFLKRVEELEIAGHRDIINRKFRVIHWLEPPTALMTPSILGRACVQGLRQMWA